MSAGTRQKITQQSTGRSTKSVDLDIGRGSCFDTVIMTIIWVSFAIFSVVITFGDWLFLPSDRLAWCQAAQLQENGLMAPEYPNPDANSDPCYHERTIYLLGWNQFECDFARRMIYSVFLGACIGFERKSADRPAGVRTMSLVSLGAAIFTMGGQFAFRSSTQEWDAARVSAAVPSGVGFLGGALIWKESIGERENQRNHVHGVTTAASVWLSASIGVASGGALWVCSTWTVVLVIFVLRFGPQFAFIDDESYRTSDESLSSGNDNDVWDNDNEFDGDDVATKESMRTFETFDHSLPKSMRTAGTSLRSRQRASVADLSMSQIERQAVNFHSD
jgi:uncharacterized membrane protein YhiD involved in acid resistance